MNKENIVSERDEQQEGHAQKRLLQPPSKNKRGLAPVLRERAVWVDSSNTGAARSRGCGAAPWAQPLASAFGQQCLPPSPARAVRAVRRRHLQRVPRRVAPGRGRLAKKRAPPRNGWRAAAGAAPRSHSTGTPRCKRGQSAKEARGAHTTTHARGGRAARFPAHDESVSSACVHASPRCQRLADPKPSPHRARGAFARA